MQIVALSTSVTLDRSVGALSPHDRVETTSPKETTIAENRNVFGEVLATCCTSPMTGFFRTGCCETRSQVAGAHLVCAQVSEAFLAFGRLMGNDLTTPMQAVGFQGLKPGDRWCLCVRRWKEALDAGVAPSVVLTATHEATLNYVSLTDLKKHAIDLS
jgi:uncharacterized protein (DUF2237 family)